MWGISLYVCQCILGYLQTSDGHGPEWPALMLNWNPAAELAVLWKGPGLSGPKLPSRRCYGSFCVFLWYCSGSRAVLLLTAEPLSEQLQPFFYSNTETCVSVFLNPPWGQFLPQSVFWDIFYVSESVASWLTSALILVPPHYRANEEFNFNRVKPEF